MSHSRPLSEPDPPDLASPGTCPSEPAGEGLSAASPGSGGPEDRLYSIGDLAAATGISCDTIRVWERRFGRPAPVRLPSGHRRYTAQDVRWLRRLAEALARGHRLGAVIHANDEELGRLLGRPALPAPDWELRQVLDMARDFRGAELQRVLRTAWSSMSPREFLERRIAPLLVGTGEAWVDGSLQVRHEHYLSELLEDLLRTLRTGIPLPAQAPVVVLATLDGEDHALGLQMAALVCATHGVQPCLLGRGAPNDEIVAAVREAHAHGLAIGVSLAHAGVSTDRTLAELRQAVPARVRIAVGGTGARGVRRGPRGLDYLDEPSFEGFERWLAALR